MIFEQQEQPYREQPYVDGLFALPTSLLRSQGCLPRPLDPRRDTDYVMEVIREGQKGISVSPFDLSTLINFDGGHSKTPRELW